MEDLSLETLLFSDAYALLTAAYGMTDCDANWQRLSDMTEQAFQKHKNKKTETLAGTLYAELLKHIQSYCTKKPEGQAERSQIWQQK